LKGWVAERMIARYPTKPMVLQQDKGSAAVRHRPARTRLRTPPVVILACGGGTLLVASAGDAIDPRRRFLIILVGFSIARSATG
jgi:hypothetical protein